MRPWSSPTSLIWLGLHLFLVLAGMLCMTTEGENVFGATLGQSFGSGLLATGVAGMALYLYVRMSERTQDRLEVIYSDQHARQTARHDRPVRRRGRTCA